MDSGRVFSADRTYVPNRYRVALNRADLAAFETYQGTVEGDLAEALHRRARARGYRLLARPEVSLVQSDQVEPGDIRVTADLLDPAVLDAGANRRPIAVGHASETSMAPGPLTMPVVAGAAESIGLSGGPSPVQHPLAFGVREPGVMTPAPPASPAPPAAPAPPGVAIARRPLAILEIRTLAGPASDYPFMGGSARVGRSRDNEIALPDDRVSRRHGQLTTRHGALVYTDLGSTNGSFVNGTRVSEIALGSGDVVRLGNSTLTIKSHH
jgi:hypothetical protein